ncbi:MAG: DNA topoisomerase I [Candidatus Verstraetearchaeota archaeon]|nr:DNA topoisomerase I [Candidatus Verstraetearchaeota archaeon]
MEKIEIWQLIHNGVLIPEYKPLGFKIKFKNQEIKLTPEQEEMAVAWVKKLSTDYVKDRIFVKNFFKDFKKALGIKEKVKPEDFDFSEIIEWLEKEKMKKESLSKEEKKILAQERKKIREENKKKYGYALVNGILMEVSNYSVEPPGIFIGRGNHPLRGRWKPAIKAEDIVLNLSPDAKIPKPPNNGSSWGAVVFDPHSLWIAKWRDKLRGKMKYVWLSDCTYLKQCRDIEKFNKAWELARVIDKVREHIFRGLESRDPFERKIATVCYLIDELKMRVGDEKDEDEADTVGATTLRPEHIKFNSDGSITFDFLGKDSVRWIRTITPPEQVYKNLKEFIAEGNECIFEGVRSQKVNAYLAEVLPGLTAKVFRTYHASIAVKNTLESFKVNKDDPIYLKKYYATMANLEAAKVCYHKRKLPKDWKEKLKKRIEKLKKLKEKGAKREKIKELELKIKIMKAVRDYNLNTSLKNYIDPRVYAEWGKRIDFDWKQYYPKSLQKRFSWVDGQDFLNLSQNKSN